MFNREGSKETRLPPQRVRGEAIHFPIEVGLVDCLSRLRCALEFPRCSNDYRRQLREFLLLSVRPTSKLLKGDRATKSGLQRFVRQMGIVVLLKESEINGDCVLLTE